MDEMQLEREMYFAEQNLKVQKESFELERMFLKLSSDL